jgi:hypothetical protein
MKKIMVEGIVAVLAFGTIINAFTTIVGARKKAGSSMESSAGRIGSIRLPKMQISK